MTLKSLTRARHGNCGHPGLAASFSISISVTLTFISRNVMCRVFLSLPTLPWTLHLLYQQHHKQHKNVMQEKEERKEGRKEREREKQQTPPANLCHVGEKNFKLRPDPRGPLARPQSTPAGKWKGAFLRAYPFPPLSPPTPSSPQTFYRRAHLRSPLGPRGPERRRTVQHHTHTFFVHWYLHAKGPARGSGPWPHCPGFFLWDEGPPLSFHRPPPSPEHHHLLITVIHVGIGEGR